MQHGIDCSKRYTGPEFDEYCISEGKYLPATRDRTPCLTCPLSNLCIPGFEEQVARIQRGENPSLTEGCAFEPGTLEPRQLLRGLSEVQVHFLKEKIPSLKDLKNE